MTIISRLRSPTPHLNGEKACRFQSSASTMREPSVPFGRTSDIIAAGHLLALLNVGPLDPMHDRVMAGGSPAFRTPLGEDFEGSSNTHPGDFILDKSFIG